MENGHKHQNHQHHHEQMKHDHHKMKHSDHSDNKKWNHKDHNKNGHNHSGHHGHMIEDFKRRFWVSLIVTIPIIIISPMIHHFFGLEDSLRFTGDMYVLFVLSSVVYFY